MTGNGALQLLLVEDDPGDVELARERLSGVPDYKFDLTCVSRLGDAVEVLEHGQVDAVILDLWLPDSKGIETLRRLRRVREDVAIVVLSGGVTEELRRSALREGAQDFIGKNEPLAQLLARIMPSALERHRALQQLRQVEKLVAATPDAVMVTDADGIVRFVNAAAVGLFGKRADDLVGQPLSFPIREGEVLQIEISRDGEPRAAETRVVRCEWEREPALLISLRDVTQARNAQLALLESEQMARGIIDTALDAFIQMDEGSRIVEWNPRAEAIFGWGRRDVIGQRLADVILPDADRQHPVEGLVRFLATGEGPILGQRLEVEAARRDGTGVNVELTVTALQRSGGCVFNGFIRDLTDKIAAEAQQRQSQKMDAIGQLTGGVAHDFNNILTVITGTIDILAGAVAHDGKLARIARMIDEAAARGAELTRRLLAFARKQPLQPRRIDVNALVIDTAKLLRPSLGEQVEVESMLRPDAWPAFADPSQLETALVNLALNARDAMADGGKLTLETLNVVLDGAYAKLNPGIRPGPYVMIAVSDTGTGIPASVRDKVFEPFFTTKEVGKGTGLGLSMVYGFAKQSGGHVKIYSEEGRGTSIKLYLPRADADAQALDEPASTAPRLGGTESILVVEDDALVCNYVVAQLQGLGYRTLAAASATEALDLIHRGAAFDLLFTDVIMPGAINGRQLAEAALKLRSGVKVLYTSGHTEDAVVHHGRLDPGVALLDKPYRKLDLARKIREALDGPAP